MKRSINKSVLFFLFTIVMMSSCALDEDLDPNSGDARDKFTGSWLFIESPAARSISYTVKISNDPSNSSQVILSNLGNFGSSHNAYGIVTSGQIVIPSQEIYSGSLIEGSGSLSSTNHMDWEYNITGGGDIEYFEAVATK